MPRPRTQSPRQSSPSNAGRPIPLSPKDGGGSATPLTVLFVDTTPKITGHAPTRKSKPSNPSLGAYKKRKQSTRSSAASTPDSEEDAGGEDEDNDDKSEDDDDEQPAGFAPSCGRKRRKHHKAGLRSGLLLHSKRKKLKVEHKEYQCHTSSEENGVVASVGSVSSTGSVDSDDVYEGVDDVSGADEEDQEVEKLEEELIVQSEYERSLESTVAGLPTGIPDEWLGLDDLENQPLYSAGSFFEDDHLFLQSGAFENIVDIDVTNEIVETPLRRVHFEDSDDSSDSDKTTDDGLVSDFLEQDCLDPDLRRMIENDNDCTSRCRLSPHELFVNNDFYQLPENIYHVDAESSVGSSSGYESESGETTDEDYPPPATITHPRSILRRDSSVSLPPHFEEANQRAQPLRRRGPLRGTFVADPYKPVAVVAPNGAQLILIPPYASSRHDWLESATSSLSNTANSSPRATTVNVVDDSDTDALVSPTQPGFSPMLSANANLVMTAMANGVGGQVMGPPETFYPSNRFSIDSSFGDYEDDDSEDLLNVDDFIDFGNGSSDEDIDKDFDDVDDLTSPVVPSSIHRSTTPTPSRDNDSSKGNSAERLLNHLDQGIVTAFRRNHSRYQALVKLHQHREFTPANSPSRPDNAFKWSRPSSQKAPIRKRRSNIYARGEAVRRKLVDSHRKNKLAVS